jgi:tetratricopeptide (TPR) repeat protein
MCAIEGTFDAEYSAVDRDELGHLDYLVGRLDELLARGLIAADVYATVLADGQGRRLAIELEGRYQGALNRARDLARTDLSAALLWAQRACELAPSREAAWSQLVDLNWKLGNDEQAIACCREAAGQFRRFHDELERLESLRVKRIDEERKKAERARQERDVKGWLAQARGALESKRDAEAIGLAGQILAIWPDHADALIVAAFAQQRSGQFDLALSSYQTLERLQPNNPTWSQWSRNVQLRRGVERITGKSPELAVQPDGARDRTAQPYRGADAAPPPISWSSFAGEFLQVHAQELLLCVAVLLIVVSSTVGAHMLLGDLLWSPVGKCALAMVATLLFAAFGAGLLRWGADRAGRMMLAATLIVVPIHFMLAGEMKLLHQPSPARLAYLGFEGLALIAMVRWVSGMLAPRAGARFLTAALLLLSVGSAATARSSPTAWEVQFASFQLSPLVFLGAVWALGARRWSETSRGHRDFVYMMFGLLGFALVACLVRTGGYALRLDAPLYGLPIMVVAISCVHAARRLVADEPDTQRLALLRLGGYALSGVAFALVLASPPGASPIFSANILAVAVAGLGLYASALRADRHPAFLYLAVGAVVAGRLGAQYFLAERLHAIEDAVRQLLRYPHHLPIAFRAIVGVVPSTALAGLSIWFAKRWDDRRLARHCHYIGVPLSIAACVASGFEPLAATICLSLYAVLYLLAIWIFDAAWVTYLAAAAIAGACYFGTFLVPDITLAAQALAASLLGLAFWAARVLLRRWHVSPGYSVPWLHAALALTGAGMFAANVHLITEGAESSTGAAAFVVIAAVGFLLNRERPRAMWAHLGLLSFVEFTICGLALAMHGRNLGSHHYGLLFIADGLTMLGAGELLRSWLNRSGGQHPAEQTGAPGNPQWVRTIMPAVARSTIVLTFVADLMGFVDIERTWLAGLVLLVGSVPLLWVTRLLRQQSFVYLGMAQLVVGALELASCAVGWHNPAVLAGWLAFAGALLGMAFWGAGVVLRRRKLTEFYTEPCFQSAFALAGAALIAANGHLVSAGVGSWTGAGSFLAITALAFLLNLERPGAIWAHLVLLGFVEFTICSLGLVTNSRSIATHHYGLLLIADGLTMLAAAEFLRQWLRRSGDPNAPHDASARTNSPWVDTLLSAIPRSAVILTFIADGLGYLGVERTWLAGLVVLLGSTPLLWVTRLRKRQSLVYLGLAQVVAGTLDLTSCATGWNQSTWMVGWLAVTGAFLALALWAAGIVLRRLRLSAFYVEPCWRTAFALVVGAYVLALEARGLGRDAYPMAAAALGLNVLVTMLLAWTWRTAELTYIAVFHFVTATYLILFSVGRNDPAMAYVLGLAAVVVAIVLWAIGIVCQRARDTWTGECARPLYHWAVFLTALAVPLSDRSFVVLALVAVSFLLTVKSLPRAEWVYAAIAALTSACYFRWLGQSPPLALIGWATLAAFVIWAFGVLIQQHKPVLCRRLDLRPLAYEFPLFHSSIVLALFAVCLRVGLGVEQAIALTAHGWFPLSLSALSLVMLRAYPRRLCVHTSLALLSWSVVAAIVPSLASPTFFGLAGLSLAVVYLLLERAVRPHEQALCARLGVIDAGYGPVVRSWALAAFCLAAGLAVFVMVVEMSVTMLGRGPIGLAHTGADWWAMLATLGLIGIFLTTLGSDPEGSNALEPEHLVVALHWLGVASLWWLGVACSPFAGGWAPAGVYYPLVTAAAGLATAQAVRRFAHDESWYELGWLGDLRSQSMERLLSVQSCVLAALAVVFTQGAIEPATAIALVLVSLTLGLVAMARGWQASALAGSIAWSAACGVTGWVVAERLGWKTAEVRLTGASVGVISSAFSLLVLADWLRRDSSILKGLSTRARGVDLELRSSLAWAMEVVAFASSLVAVVAVLAAATSAAAPGAWVTTVGVGVILSAALLQILLVPRWRAEWLVYLAQATMLCAYVDYRLAVPRPIAFDVIVFTLLGYLDLGIAEVLDRQKLKIYARPARFLSLMLPSLALFEVIGRGGMNEVDLFHLLAAGTFYGIACGRLRWKTLGYAAAVLYNAALWVLWGKFGWKLSTHPQFFMVPVGLSTMLFAEVNRRELGRPNANTIRTVGLTIVYLSMALPIWQYEQNFGAWVALLIGSLVGVFLGIGLRLQTFLWMGLTTFVLNVVYEMGRMSLDYALAKWAIMLALGIALVMFVALNEKKRIMGTMRLFYDQARLWE